MKAKSLFSILLLFLGVTFVLITVISEYLTLLSFKERQHHGPCLFFADMEIFGLATVLFTLLSVIAILDYKKILRQIKHDE